MTQEIPAEDGDIWKEVYTPCPVCCRHLGTALVPECPYCGIPLPAPVHRVESPFTLADLEAEIERLRNECA